MGNKERIVEKVDEMGSLLNVRGLKTTFQTEQGKIVSVDDVSFELKPGEKLALVGESGSGKSATALSIMQLLGKRGNIEQGELLFEGKNLLNLDKKQLQQIRGHEISMIFQEAVTSLNPVLTIGFQLVEAIRLHLPLNKRSARQLAIDMLEKVGIPQAERMMKQYPFVLSGGMKQRVMIAMALACKPKLLIADEPTTALDVTVQAQIMKLLKELCHESNTAIMLITHDLGVVAQMADRVIVMYAGQVVESADVYTLFESPKHPYTKALLASIPFVESDVQDLASIPGSIPERHHSVIGCRFANRCELATEYCRLKEPELFDLVDRNLRCFKGDSKKDLGGGYS